MDIRTQRKIDEINASIPMELKNALVKKKSRDEQYKMREMAQYTLDKLNDGTTKISEQEQQQLKHQMEAILGQEIKDEEYVDPEIAKEIDAYLDAKIKKAIRTGEIPKITKRQYEEELRKING